MNTNKGKHLTLDERIEIQECLNHGMTFKDISKRIGKDQTTVSKEVKRHIKTHMNSFVTITECCPNLLKAPFVCNGCPKRTYSSCRYQRHLYIAKSAQSDYASLLVEAREGIPLNKESFYETERVISEAVRRGQHVYHATQTYKLPVSVATVYRHIKKRYYTISAIDLPRAVKFKPRYSRTTEFVPKCVKINRSYEDFQEYCTQHDVCSYVEMDTVIGRVGGKVILTLHFTSPNFMVGLLLENKTSAEVIFKLNDLKQKLLQRGFSFGKLIPIILTDNGGEFSCVQNIESGVDDINSQLFFCDPNMPTEKARIEKNHTLFRDIVPKGSSFDDFTQDTLNLIFSHVNSVKRSKFNGRSAHDMFSFTYSETLAAALDISKIPAELVNQSPSLLKL